MFYNQEKNNKYDYKNFVQYTLLQSKLIKYNE